MKKLLVLLCCLGLFGLSFSSTYAAENSSSCQGMTITPQKTAYTPGEIVNLSVTGSGFVSDIKMYFMPAMQNLTKTDPYFWQEISTGSFNPATKTWSGTWTVPNTNGEYVVTPNVINSAGGLCSGNPGYTCQGCHSGIFAGAPIVTVASVSPSSVLSEAFSHTHLTDGRIDTSWSSSQRLGADISASPEWVTFDLGSPRVVSKMVLTPRVYEGQIQAFPTSFHLAYSDNGSNWTIIPNHTYTNYPKPSVTSQGMATKQEFAVSGTHRYWSVGINKVGQDVFGGFYAQLAEVEFGTQPIAAGETACTGCQKTVVVNSNYGQTGGFDLTKYWNFSPGYSWNYTGLNYRTVPPQPFKTRFEIEEKVNMCTYDVLPWRFTKDNAWGYWYPKDPTGVDGLHNLRFFISYFENGVRWSPTSMGALFSKTYLVPTNSPNPIASIGTYCATCSEFRTFDSKSFSHTFYAPYLYAEKNIPNLWQHERVDKFYVENTANMCSLSYDPNPTHRYWNIQYIQDTVNTPAYSGPALRFRQIEGDYPAFAFWHIREDWWFAEGIGIVQVDEKNLMGKCPGDPDCLGTAKMQNPQTQLKLTSMYTGQALSANLSSSQVAPTGTFTITFANAYTGQLVVKACTGQTCTPGVPTVWNKNNGQMVWVNNGVVTLNVNEMPLLNVGKNHLFFRPLVQTSPQGTTGETQVSTTQLPWSNEVILEVSPVFTTLQLKTLFGNYGTNLDSQYLPVDGKVNSMDAVYVLLHL